jgi:hypothetical protein
MTFTVMRCSCLRLVIFSCFLFIFTSVILQIFAGSQKLVYMIFLCLETIWSIWKWLQSMTEWPLLPTPPSSGFIGLPTYQFNESDKKPRDL